NEWAQWQVKLGWIVTSLLHQQSEWFSTEQTLAARCHAFEACLFMIGYDLRCFSLSDDDISDPHPSSEKKATRKANGWVPTGHTLKTSLDLYLEFRDKDRSTEDNRSSFKKWLREEKNLGD